MAFLFVLATVDVVHDAPWGWRIAAFVFCFLGDVFLMLPRDAFVPGLASFAIAQMLFAISFATGETNGGRALVGFLIVLPIAALLARRFIRAIRITGPVELVAPVAVYMLVISAMTIAAIAEGSPIAIAGAAIFMMSDSLIAETRFVKAREWHSQASRSVSFEANHSNARWTCVSQWWSWGESNPRPSGAIYQ